MPIAGVRPDEHPAQVVRPRGGKSATSAKRMSRESSQPAAHFR